MSTGLDRVMDALPAMVWTVDPEGRADSVNRRWSEYAGPSPDGARGRDWQAAAHPDEVSDLLECWRAILASGKAGDIQARLRRHDGQYRRHLINCSPMHDSAGQIVNWCLLATDVEDFQRAEWRSAEDALADQIRQSSQILDSIPARVGIYDVAGVRISANKQAIELSAAARAVDWRDLIHPDDLPLAEKRWRTALATGEPFECEYRVRMADGTYRWHQGRRAPMHDNSGKIVRWFGVSSDIEDLKRAEHRLIDSEHQLRMIVDTIPGLVAIFGPDRQVEGLNKQLMEYLGQTPQDFARWEVNGTVHADDLARCINIFKSALEGGLPIDFEARLRRYDGAYRWVQVRGNAARDATGNIVRWYCLMVDIDERKHAEDALKRSEAFLAEGQHLARMGNFSWHLASGQIAGSEQLYKIFELKPDTVVTLDLVSSRCHPDDMPVMLDMVERAKRGESEFEYQYRIVLPDRSIKHLHLIARRAPELEDKAEYLGAIIDVTHRRLSEEALERLRSELAQVTRIMSLGALTASIAHEVNQPLAGIVTNASTCLRMLGADPPNVDGAQETARRTIRDAQRAADIITRLRKLFSKRAIAFEPVDLNDAVREVIALSSSDLRHHGVTLRAEMAEGLPYVAGDRVQLQQVVMNFIRNAADAMSSVDDRARVVVVRTAPEDDQVLLSVRDTGVGFEPNEAGRLFDAFYTTKSDGMGIGLSVSKSIVEMHNGRLWAQANNGPGATFSFLVPCYVGDAAAVGNAFPNHSATVATLATTAVRP
ncbi:PAS domain-containing protein [Mesorhizobium abyssinicae]|uniref:PAS domain-containing protein n=1 Tax=Mesorhizobium abyssinicae TaxID=1209958 RepID=UPI003396708B